MLKLCFLGAGSTVFAKNVLGDCIMTPELGEFEISLHDIDPVRLEDSYRMLNNININAGGHAVITKSLDRKKALEGAKYVVNAIQVGGYEPSTVIDFDIPKKYGLRQTIADTLGIGGIFRALRTIPVLEDFAKDVKEVCPKDYLFINYSNPMAMLTGYLQNYLNITSVGLCHSVQVCSKAVLEGVGMNEYIGNVHWKVAGINHQSWLLEITDKDGNDLYPEIKRRAAVLVKDRNGIAKNDLVRMEMMLRFGYYITESSEHTSEYTPWFIKDRYPELIERYNIPLDEYPRRCVNQIEEWKKRREELTNNAQLSHKKTYEFAAYIIKAMETDQAFRIHGNVRNNGLITNLPANACVEVPCLVDGNGVTPCKVGDLPEQCAAINRTNVNVQLLTMKAAASRKREDVYMAAYMDPHTSSELNLDDIKSMCDDLFTAHGDMMPRYE